MSQPVSINDGAKEIVGDWFIKNVQGAVQLKMEGDEELKKAQDEVKFLKAELERLTALPTKPSLGLVAALDAAAACKPSSTLSSDAPTHVASERPPLLELTGKRVLVVGHGPVGHDFVPRPATSCNTKHVQCVL
eukprot:s5824_g5.t1